MRDTLRRFFITTAGVVVAYLLLHVLRSFDVEPEVRGIWAGATGCMVSGLVEGFMTGSKRGRRRKS
jgi:zinc transporter ZupT